MALTLRENCMNVDEIRKFCMAFPGATEKLQWDDALCFKVNGKIFVVLTLDRLRLTFKCPPEVFAELVEREDIRPSPYLGRYHWVMLERLDALRRDELEDGIRQSYEMVAAKAPKAAGKKAGRKTAKKAAKKKGARPATSTAESSKAKSSTKKSSTKKR